MPINCPLFRTNKTNIKESLIGYLPEIGRNLEQRDKLSIFLLHFLKHLMMLLKCNFFQGFIFALYQSMLGHAAQIFKSGNIVKQCL